MSSFSVTLDQEQLAAVKTMLNAIPDLAETVVYKAINKTMAGVKTDISEGVRGVVTADKETVDGKISVKNASLKTLSGKVSLSGQPLPISKFPLRQEPPGAVVDIYKARSGRMLTSAFAATMKSGHAGVFRRVTRISPAGRPVIRPWKKMPKKYRLPIEEMYGPSLGTILQSAPVMEPVLDKLGTRMDENLETQTALALRKL